MLYVSLACIVGFTALLVLLDVYFKKTSAERGEIYRSWERKKQIDFIARIVSLTHATILLFFVFRALFFSCKGDPKEGSDSYTSLFVNDYCLGTFEDFYSYVPTAILFGFLAYDTICIAIYLHENNADTWQMYAHHAVGLIALFLLVILGEPAPIKLANVILLNEISTYFLNYRTFMLNFKMEKSKWYMYNGLMFALTFFLFRVVVNTILIFYVVKLWIILGDKYELDVDPSKNWELLLLGAICTIGFAILYVLNVYWFVKVIAHARRNL